MKSSLRQHYKAVRLSLSACPDRDVAIGQHLRPFLKHSVAGYWPLKGEVDWKNFAATIDSMPCIEPSTAHLVFRRWDGHAGTLTGYPPQPKATCPAVLPEAILVPMLAFDRRGYRLGYGGGWYDKTLAHLRQHYQPMVIGLAYAAQEHPALPTEAFDEKMTCIVTENGVYRPL